MTAHLMQDNLLWPQSPPLKINFGFWHLFDGNASLFGGVPCPRSPILQDKNNMISYTQSLNLSLRGMVIFHRLTEYVY